MKYDLAVIGGGPGGGTPADAAPKAGRAVVGVISEVPTAELP